MKAKLISIGSEILNGQTLNTNSVFAGKELSRIGIELSSSETVRDEEKSILRAFTNIEKDISLVLITGGLGPTEDDITRFSFAKALDLKLKESAKAKAKINDFFEKAGRKPTQTNYVQAIIPEGCTLIDNSWGTAPGFYIDIDSIIYACFPGVPKEFEQMFLHFADSVLKARTHETDKKERKYFKMYGIPESKVADIVRDIERPPGIELGFYPRFPEVHLEFSYSSGLSNDAETLKYLENTFEALKDFIFSVDEDSIAQKLIDALIKNQLTLSIAESCTGGLISQTVVDVPGSSKCFNLGLVSYSNSAKVELLGVSLATVEKFGSVSGDCAIEMAAGVRAKGKTDIGISTTGIAGPTGGTAEKPVGTTFIGFSTSKETFAKQFTFKRDRNENRKLTMYHAITGLIKLINTGKIR